MERVKYLFMVLFFLCVNSALMYCDNCYVKANAYGEENKNIEILIDNKKYKFKLEELEKESSKIKSDLINEHGFKTAIEKLKRLGFNEEEISTYLYPQIENIYGLIEQNYYRNEEKDEIFVVKNSCKIKINKGKGGVYLDKKEFYKKFIDELKKENNEINIKIKTKKFKNEEIKQEDFVLRSTFLTNFETSSDERKNNIRLALSNFDGILLEEGEILSFNNTTGERNQEKGYMSAKIISGGTFIEGYGGGVCQVSTTLYNACLLAGLEILEVHSHSLPVSYVEPSFDAMVNQGSSDLIIKNNTNGKIIITTSNEGDRCKVAIFGKKNEYKIERMSEKTTTLPSSSERIIETDLKKYGVSELEDGQEKIISYAKDGFCSNGYLKYYDNDGRLIKTQKVRESKYYPTKTIVVKKEK